MAKTAMKNLNNSTSEIIREEISQFLSHEVKDGKKQFKELKGIEKVRAFTDLLNYSVPKLQNLSLDIDYTQLTEEQLDYIIAGLKKKSK
jgi:hypothetical protein